VIHIIASYVYCRRILRHQNLTVAKIVLTNNNLMFSFH